jgi:hypothetical protein
VRADALAGVVKAAGVTEFGENRDRRQRPDPEVAHQGAAAGLTLGIVAQPGVERDELRLDRIDERERGGDLLARVAGQLQLGEPLARFDAEQPCPGRDAVVIEHRLHPLLPLATLVDERVPQPHPGAELEQVLGRDPGLRQPARGQQLAKMLRVSAVGFGAPLGSAQRGGLSRLGQVHPGADRPAQTSGVHVLTG